MSVLGPPLPEQESVTAAAVQRLRQQAAFYRRMAASTDRRKLAALMTAMSREYEEHAIRLEVRLITARVIQ